jgi:hypothetical protein
VFILDDLITAPFKRRHGGSSRVVTAAEEEANRRRSGRIGTGCELYLLLRDGADHAKRSSTLRRARCSTGSMKGSNKPPPPEGDEGRGGDEDNEEAKGRRTKDEGDEDEDAEDEEDEAGQRQPEQSPLGPQRTGTARPAVKN